MLAKSELNRIARSRLADAAALIRARRYHGAVYVCGLAVEIRLKARICRTLKWTHFPQTRGEFQDYLSLRTHNLDVLLRLSGIEARIRDRFATEWTAISQWNPEIRYNPEWATTAADARAFYRAAQSLLKVI